MQHTYIILYSEKNRFHTPLDPLNFLPKRWMFGSFGPASSGASPTGSAAGQAPSRWVARLRPWGKRPVVVVIYFKLDDLDDQICSYGKGHDFGCCNIIQL